MRSIITIVSTLAIALAIHAADPAALAEKHASSPAVIEIPAGDFVFGSDRAEREAGYRLDEAAYKHRVTREQRWYESEFKRQVSHADTYSITKTPITNAQYQAFVRATGHPAPDVDQPTWKGYGLIHPWSRTRRHAWADDKPPVGRENHPVVLVSLHDAEKFAAWLTTVTPYRWRLPTEREWEKAARGGDGRWFPWGNDFDPSRLNSHDKGPFDTMPVGTFLAGASPFGMLDAAGQVFEWTATSSGQARAIVKGGSWDDKGCGVCRSAARHTRPHGLKHILVGFRLVRETR